MAGQQFDEIIPLVFAAQQDSTFNASTTMDLTGNPNSIRRWDQLLLKNTDTVTHTFTFIHYDNSVNTNFATVDVPAGAGVGTVPPVDAIAQIFGTTYQYYTTPQNYAIHGKWDAAPASGKFLAWLVKGGML